MSDSDEEPLEISNTTTLNAQLLEIEKKNHKMAEIREKRKKINDRNVQQKIQKTARKSIINEAASHLAEEPVASETAATNGKVVRQKNNNKKTSRFTTNQTQLTDDILNFKNNLLKKKKQMIYGGFTRKPQPNQGKK